MALKKRFGIIGGDSRQIYATQELEKLGNEVYICGFENFNNQNYKTLKINEVISKSDYIILPLPITRDGININAPFSSTVIEINKDIFMLLKNKVIFGGIVTSLLESVKNWGIHIHDYYDREDFILSNALLTAEGAIKVALEESKRTIFGSRILVVGYGRIGKILANLLKNLGSSVTISARNPNDRAWAEINNLKTIDISNLDSEIQFDIIFNTVPAKILVYKNMKLIRDCNLIIDLASLPGGVDKSDAEKLGMNVVNALGLPGKFFPKSAGKIVVDTIYKIIQEEGL